jgi:hypothetical protein
VNWLLGRVALVEGAFHAAKEPGLRGAAWVLAECRQHIARTIAWSLRTSRRGHRGQEGGMSHTLERVQPPARLG